MEVNEEIDVYSFGVITLEVIMGKHQGDLISCLLPSPLQAVDVLLNDVLDQCLSPPRRGIADQHSDKNTDKPTPDKKLSYTQLTPNKLTIPPSMTNLPPGKERSVQALQSSDKERSTIPMSIGNLSKLTELELSKNKIVGFIPNEIGQLKSLTVLYLYGNQLTGSIPVSIGKLGKLTNLQLDGNNIIGSIPNEIGQLKLLTNLYLHGNQLIGSIPESIGNLSKLTNLKLSRNKIVGSIPIEIGQLK
ncbi:probable leucine-rich repeat receptor-like protein kinase At1g35710 [Ziziphus jujuba]|uniref:non-specific serine/threonine protein kinase n=1 Tax=Ziziphus jujuba TaxID=326968 RepID=A0ABM3IPM8_ZIZJJ|nr:probable leucine-rich repeat receptor-like protein kinase At1g35710 [Ziziphus jujuba]